MHELAIVFQNSILVMPIDWFPLRGWSFAPNATCGTNITTFNHNIIQPQMNLLFDGLIKIFNNKKKSNAVFGLLSKTIKFLSKMFYNLQQNQIIT